MLGQIRRHQKWLWVLVAGATIISFVVFMDPNFGRRGRGIRRSGSGSDNDHGFINGRPISAEEFEQAKREAWLSFLMRYGRWPDEDERSRQLFNPDRAVAERLFLIEKLRELNIQVSDAAVVDWIATTFRDRDQGAFRMEYYQQLVQRQLPQRGLSERDFRHFVQHQIGIEHLVALGELTGSLVTPREAAELYRRENEQVTAEMVLYSVSNYLASVSLDPAAVGQFYTNNMSRYRVPEKVQVSYVKFDSTNFLAEADQRLAQVTNLSQLIEQAYVKRGPEFYKDSEGKTMSREAALQKIGEDERKNAAMALAQKKATEFMQELYSLYEKEPKQLDNLERLAAANGLQSAVTEPFTKSEGPKSLKVLDSFAEVAFALSPDQPIPDEPLPGNDAFYVIAFKKKIPSELQPFDAVRDKVVEEYRRREAEQAARKTGQAFYATLTNGFAQNKSFQAICLEANVLTAKLPPISLSTRSLPGWEGRVDLAVLQEVTATLAAGKTSGFVPTRDGGLIVHVVSRQPADEAKLKTELPAYIERLREERRREALNEWFRKEFELARISGLPQFKKSNPRQND